MLPRPSMFMAALIPYLVGGQLARAQADLEVPPPTEKDATIECISYPEGARIFVGHPEQHIGYFKGITPCTITIYGAVGMARPYRMCLRKHGYDEWSREFRIAKGEHQRVVAQLEVQSKLAYVRGNSLIVQGYDGSNPRVVASLDESFLADSLVWSRDGRKLAFAMGGDIRFVECAGGPSRQVTDIRAMATRAGAGADWFCDNPVWFPDGRRIAFRVVGGQEKLFLCSAPTEGGEAPLRHFDNIVAITQFHPETPTLAAEDVKSVLLINMAGDEPPRVIQGATDARWSPDGSRLAFVQAGQIVIADDKGNAPQPLTAFERVAAMSPRWSPDGKRLCMLVDRAGPEDVHAYEIYLAEVEGETPPRRVLPREGEPPFNEYIQLLGFAPDGERIAYMRGAQGQADLHLVSPDGAADQVLLSGITVATWSCPLPLALTGDLQLFQRLLQEAVEYYALDALLEYAADELALVVRGKTQRRVSGKERQDLLSKALDGLQPVPLEQLVVRLVQRDVSEFDAEAGGVGEDVVAHTPRLHLRVTEGQWRIAGVELSAR